MPKIFISYRRADTQPIVGRIYEHLARSFGADNVFMDVQDIPAGEHFKAYLEQQVAACDILLAIIGPQWLAISDPEGQRRLDDPDDFVRIEVELGLKRADVRVVPVLIHDTAMPAAEDLPDALRDLHFRNASRVRYDPDFVADMLKLIGQLGGNVARPVRASNRWKWVLASLLALLVLALLAVSVIGSGFFTRLFFPFVEVSQTAYAAMTQRAATEAAGAAVTETAVATATEGPGVTLLRGAALRQAPATNAVRVALLLADAHATVQEVSADGDWLYLRLDDGQEGWARRDTLDIEEDFLWRALFTSPDGGTDSDRSVWSGIDLQFARSIDAARATIDLAAFELDHPLIYEALLNADQRGVRVRVVTDNEFGLDATRYAACRAEPDATAFTACFWDNVDLLPEETYFDDLYDAGIPIVDDGRSGLMHHDFAILDGVEVWAGSWGYTINGTYRNNNNVLEMRDAGVVARFQAEFNLMFEEHVFNHATGAPSLTALAAGGQFATAFFTPGNDDTLPLLLDLVNSAEELGAADAVQFHPERSGRGAGRAPGAGRAGRGHHGDGWQSNPVF